VAHYQKAVSGSGFWYSHS